MKFFLITMAIALVLSACGGRNPAPPVATVTPASGSLPPMRWDFKPEGAEWTRASFAALSTHGTPLSSLVPADIRDWCPAYPNRGRADRDAFWTGLLSALAKHESTWNASAIGGGDQWFGLVQISPATARGYGCNAQSGSDLLSGPANLSCAIRIMAVTVPRDGVVSAGRGGVAADWAPFLNSEKRADMAAWTRAQPYCQ